MFNELLKELRTKKGVTQSQLAQAVGVSPGNVGDWETGKSKPGYVAIATLARFFEVSADYLLGLETANASDRRPNALLTCDGVPLSELEADLVAMFRLIPDADKQTIFDIVKLKYEQSTGEKISIYSTYIEENAQQKSDPTNGDNTKSGTA